MKRVSNRKDLASGLCLLAVGASYSLLSFRYPVWGDTGPQEGFYPFLIGLILTGLSLVIMANAFRVKEGEPEKAQPQSKEGVTRLRAFLYVGLVILYGLVFEKAGFVLSSGVFLFVVLKYVERQSWKITISVGIISVVVSHILFAYLLGVPLPKGFLALW
jgi:putative tricarboxylic transport membrane protein